MNIIGLKSWILISREWLVSTSVLLSVASDSYFYVFWALPHFDVVESHNNNEKVILTD